MQNYQTAEPSIKFSKLYLLDSRCETFSGNWMIVFIQIKHICKTDLTYI